MLETLLDYVGQEIPFKKKTISCGAVNLNIFRKEISKRFKVSFVDHIVLSILKGSEIPLDGSRKNTLSTDLIEYG